VGGQVSLKDAPLFHYAEDRFHSYFSLVWHRTPTSSRSGGSSSPVRVLLMRLTPVACVRPEPLACHWTPDRGTDKHNVVSGSRALPAGIVQEEDGFL
jgi:hypothetical protein